MYFGATFLTSLLTSSETKRNHVQPSTFTTNYTEKGKKAHSFLFETGTAGASFLFTGVPFVFHLIFCPKKGRGKIGPVGVKGRSLENKVKAGNVGSDPPGDRQTFVNTVLEHN